MTETRTGKGREACTHEQRETITTRCFTECVGLFPLSNGRVIDRCNPAAHGGVIERQRCVSCMKVRDVAVNGGHSERGFWFKES
jgi:hypothetical protein